MFERMRRNRATETTDGTYDNGPAFQRGNGYAPEILTRIGEPYVTKRQREDTAGGLGLGLFIAKTLLERSGASLIFENREPENAGARIRIEWPRILIDANSTK